MCKYVLGRKDTISKYTKQETVSCACRTVNFGLKRKSCSGTHTPFQFSLAGANRYACTDGGSSEHQSCTVNCRQVRNDYCKVSDFIYIFFLKIGSWEPLREIKQINSRRYFSSKWQILLDY